MPNFRSTNKDRMTGFAVESDFKMFWLLSDHVKLALISAGHAEIITVCYAGDTWDADAGRSNRRGMLTSRDRISDRRLFELIVAGQR